jgi:hypothetical protein
VSLEVEAQIKNRFTDDVVCTQEEGNEQPPEPPVAIEKWMNGLELHVNQASLDEQREIRTSSCKKSSRLLMQSRTRSGGGGTKEAFPGPRTADPVLASSEFARLLFATATLREQDIVNFTN